jgi:hypothetical protein
MHKEPHPHPSLQDMFCRVPPLRPAWADRAGSYTPASVVSSSFLEAFSLLCLNVLGLCAASVGWREQRILL